MSSRLGLLPLPAPGRAPTGVAVKSRAGAHRRLSHLGKETSRRVCRRGRGRRASAGHGEGTGDQAPRAERVREQERVTLSPHVALPHRESRLQVPAAPPQAPVTHAT